MHILIMQIVLGVSSKAHIAAPIAPRCFQVSSNC